MTYGEWIGAETRKEFKLETIAKKLKKGRTPEWIHEEDEYPLELILEVQASMGNEMYKRDLQVWQAKDEK